MNFFRTDQKLYERLKAGDAKAFDKIYRDNFTKVQRLARINGMVIEDTEDFFHDVLIAFWKSINNEKFELGKSELSAYLFGIAKNKLKDWFKTKGRNRIMSLMSDVFIGDESIEEMYDNMDEVVKLALGRIGETCQRIFEMYYFKELSMEEIASKMGLKSAKVAKDRKYECMKKARKIAFDLLKRY